MEIEIKIKVKNLFHTKQALSDLGFVTVTPECLETNLVFDTDNFDLKKNNRLLRLRKSGNKVILTAKAPTKNKTDPQYKSRQEKEIEVADFNRSLDFFTLLGYRVVFVYEKYREIMTNSETAVMLDRTPIGDFIEIEGDPAAIDATASALGFSKTEYITENYRSLFIRHGGRGNMVFRS